MSARESQRERRKLSLNAVISRTMELQKVSLAIEKVTVELGLEEALPSVVGDAGQLQQVLMNLVGNARQAIEQSGQGGAIRISTRSIRSGRTVQLEVSDDGPGIPQAIVSRIFDPFFTTKPAGSGTGLGLAIVVGVVREHGGQVKVASPPGGGAVFSLEFPAAPAAQIAVAGASSTALDWPNRERADVPRLHTAGQPSQPSQLLQPLTGSPEPSKSRSNIRVLVVEDEPTVARLISDVLEDEGFQVEAFSDGHQALDRAARESYDLVVCDMKMPGLDGQQFYETLANTGNPLWKRFLFVTGDVLSSHTHEFLERHRLPHVAKPFRVEELTEKVRRMVVEIGPAEASTQPSSKDERFDGLRTQGAS
jgi:CheY-like chemotaxis protein